MYVLLLPMAVWKFPACTEMNHLVYYTKFNIVHPQHLYNFFVLYFAEPCFEAVPSDQPYTSGQQISMAYKFRIY